MLYCVERVCFAIQYCIDRICFIDRVCFAILYHIDRVCFMDRVCFAVLYRQGMLCHCVQDANRSVYFFRKTIADIDQSEFDGFEYVNPLLMSMEDCV